MSTPSGPNTDCLDDHELSDLVGGTLTGADRQRLTAHVDQCGECRRRVERASLAFFTEAQAHRLASTSAVGGPDGTAPAASPDLVTTARPNGHGGAAAEPPAADVMVDHFRLLRLLGRGGMGDVYLARDTKLGRKVALKVIRLQHLASASAATQFLREARMTAKFSHPHIVAVHAVGDFAGLPYLALEYLEGQNLRERLAERQPSLRETIRIGLAVAQALAEAHDRSILHRDLKPENIVIPRDGRVRVVDFGLAKRVPGAEALTDSTGDGPASTRPDGGVVGTPAYLAPELWEGQSSSPAADVWALGVTLFELCAGHRPFTGPSEERLALAVATDEPSPALADHAEVPKPLAELVDRCLAKAPADRPEAAEVAVALEAQLYGRPGAGIRRNPFRGLLPFTEQEAPLFFGREEEIVAFCERLRHEPVLPVVGPSGGGKSSFVRAGVIPRLAEQQLWTVLHLRPGGHPLQSLAARIVTWRSSDDGAAPTATEDLEAAEQLARQLGSSPPRLGLELRTIARQTDSQVLLFVDQLEEVFTLGSDPAERRCFLEAVCAAADDPDDPIRVILALRDDFLGRTVASPAAREALSHVTVLQPPTDQALAQILSAPLELVGYGTDDPELIPSLVAEVSGEPSGLPLLQFGAAQLWERRDQVRKLLLRERYDEMGGVAGALAGHADAVIDALPSTDRSLARALLLRLVTPERTRRVVSESHLLGGLDSEAATVLARLTRARLVSASRAGGDQRGAQLELVHESLIANWHTLHRWIDEAREELLFLAEVGQAAERWHERDHQDEDLLQGDALRDALRGARKCSTQLPVLVSDYLERSRARQRRRVRRRRTVEASAFAVLVIALGWAVYAVLRISDKEREARRQERAAQHEQVEALRESARAAYGRGRLLEARAKLRLALEADDSAAARGLWWQLDAEPLLWRRELGAFVYSVAFSPRGDWVAGASQDGSVYLFDPHTATPRVLRGHADQVVDVAFSSDGKIVGSGSVDGEVRVWNVAEGTTQVAIAVGARVAAVVFSPGGQQIVSGDTQGMVRFWDSETGEPGLAFGGSHGGVADLAFRPDGRLIATCVSPPRPGVRLCDASTGRVVRTIELDAKGCRRVRFSADGKRLATVTASGSAHVFDVASGTALATLDSHQGGTDSLSFTPDGTALALGRHDGAIQVWPLPAGPARAWSRGEEEAINELQHGPEGRLLVTASRAGSISLWNVAAAPTDHGLGPHSAAVFGVRFSPDGRLLATSSTDKTARLWDVATGQPIRAFRGHTAVVSDVRFSPDGQRLVTASYDNSVRVWDVSEGVELQQLRGHTGVVRAATFNPAGTLVASAGGSAVRLWETDTGRATQVLRCGGYPADVGFSGDGREIAATSNDGHLCRWHLGSGLPIRDDDHGAGVIRSLRYSPDDGQIAVAHEREGVLVLDRQTNDLRVLRRDWGRAYTAVFHPAGQHLGIASSDHVGRVIRLDDQSVVPLRGHRGEVNRIHFHPDGQLVATCSDDGTLRLWDGQTGNPHWRAPLLLAQPPRLLTHRGWKSLAKGAADQPPWPGGPEARRLVEQDARHAVRARAGTTDRLCAWLYDESIEVWDLSNDRRLSRHEPRAPQALFASHGRCVALADGQVYLLDGAPEPHRLELGAPATALAVGAGRILVAVAGTVLALDETGVEQARFDTGGGVLTMALPEGDDDLRGPPRALIVGYGDGNVELRALDGADSRFFEQTPSARPARLVAGPRGTAVVGYTNGVVGLWDQRDGSPIARAQLHGAVVHLLLEDGQLYAATDLGDHLVWDLGAYYRDHCHLLRHLWRTSGVVWQDGRAVKRPPPQGHRCAPR